MNNRRHNWTIRLNKVASGVPYFGMAEGDKSQVTGPSGGWGLVY